MFLTRPCKAVSPSWVLAALAVIVYGAVATSPEITADIQSGEEISENKASITLTCSLNATTVSWFQGVNKMNGTATTLIVEKANAGPYECAAAASEVDKSVPFIVNWASASSGQSSPVNKPTATITYDNGVLNVDNKVPMATASVKLTCASKDALTFNWFKKTSTGDVRVSVAGASNSYQETAIHTVLKAQEGTFYCQGVNKDDEGMGSDDVKVVWVKPESAMFDFSKEVQYMCKIKQGNPFQKKVVIPDKDHSNPCYKWSRDKEFIKRYKDNILIDRTSFWNIEVTLEVNYTNMKPWYNNTLMVKAVAMFGEKLCEIDLEKCDDKTKSTDTNECKCIKVMDVEGKAGFKTYTVYVNQKADMNKHANRHIQLILQPKIELEEPKKIFNIGYNAGNIPFIQLACKTRCDKFKKDAGDKCDYDAAEKKKCEEEQCPCDKTKKYYQRDLPGEEDPKGKYAPAGDATHVMFSITSLASLLCFWTALFAESF